MALCHNQEETSHASTHAPIYEQPQPVHALLPSRYGAPGGAVMSKPLLTAQIVRDLAEVLTDPNLPIRADAAIARALTRLIESEPRNRELDEWREFIRETNKED